MSSSSQRLEQRRRSGPRAPLTVRVVFALALGLTLIGLVEIGFQLANLYTGGSLVTRLTPDRELGIRSWTVHHAMRPGYDIPPVRTNSFGLRSPEVAVPKPSGVFRILLLGDSFTFGFRAAGEVVFARRLEEILRSRGHASVEVVNAGVLSYCPLLEYLQYRHHLHALEPDLVVLNFDMSDVQDHLEYSRHLVVGADGRPLFVTEPSLRRPVGTTIGLLSFRWIVNQYVTPARRRTEAALEGSPFARDEDRYLWALDEGPAMDEEVGNTLAPIGDLAALLRHERIPLLLATYPQPWQVSRTATPLPPIRDQYAVGRDRVHLNDRPFKKLATFAAAQGLPFFDATAAFRRERDPAGLFLADDFHFTARGHALYAGQLASYLLEHGLAGSERPAPAP
jgi:lysophospholipase L1-like esterase